jgi:two-component sensor histidine kinase
VQGVNIVVAEHHNDLSIAREQMRKQILQLEDLVALQERQRIAREIHDSLGNALTSLNIQLQTAHKLWNIEPAQAEQFLEQAQRLGAIAIQEVRQSVRSIREIAPKEESLTEMIDSLVQNFHQATGILPSTSINLSVSLPHEVSATIYRIIQESLTNICKYARATQVEIDICHNSNIVRLLILDNGKGFNLSENKNGFGLQGMRERVAALKGNFNLDAEPGLGCQITVYLPLSQETIRETNLTIVDTISSQKTSGKERHLKLVETIPDSHPDSFIRDCYLKLVDTVSQPETLVRDCYLQLVDTVPQAELPAKNLSLQIFDAIENAENTFDINVDINIDDFQHQLDCKNLSLQIFDAIENAENTSDINVDIDIDEFLHQLDIEPEDYRQIEEILRGIVGPMASKLLEKVAARACNCQELIDNLKFYLDDKQHLKLEKETMFLFQQPATKKKVNSYDLLDEEEFVNECEEKLVELLGPVAYYMVQKIIELSRPISRTELVKLLVGKIAEI